MKLTREGAARLGRHESRGFPVSDFEFKPEDFDGCCQNGNDHVVLTVEEAKEIYKVLDMGLEACIHEYECEWEFNPERQVRRAFKAKIEQAEGK